METFPGAVLGELVALRLDRGDDLLASIETAARHRAIHTGLVLSGIGTLDRARLHHITHTAYPPQDAIVEYQGPIELLSIQGLIADHVPHLHTCISIADKTYMGHLEPGCRVLYLAEIALARLDGLRLCRRPHPDTAVNLLQLAE